MSVKIEITDPSKTSPVELKAIIRFLSEFSGAATVAEPRLPIAEADLPDAGAPTDLTAQQAFSPTGDLAAAAAFGGNVSGATLGASFQMPALPGIVALPNQTEAPTTGMPAAPEVAFVFNPPTGIVANMPALTTEQRDAAAGAQSLPGPLLDSKGDRWDERIHAGSKTTNKDGAWKLKPKVDKTLVDQVLAANKGAGTPPFQNTAPTLPAGGPAGIPQMSAPAAPLLPNPTPAATPPAAVTTASPSNVTYPALVGAIQQRMVAGHLSVPEMTDICMRHGAADIPSLVAASPEVLGSVYAHLAQLLASKGVA